MCRVLIIGAGGVGTVVAHKVEIAAAVGGNRIQTAQVDADHVEELTGLMRSFKPDIVINVALPYQDLTIMEACLEAGVNYLDTANYEPKDEAHFEYSWQWAYHERFKEKGYSGMWIRSGRIGDLYRLCCQTSLR